MILNRIELSFDQPKIRQSRILRRDWASKRNRSETSLIAKGPERKRREGWGSLLSENPAALAVAVRFSIETAHQLILGGANRCVCRAGMA